MNVSKERRRVPASALLASRRYSRRFGFPLPLEQGNDVPIIGLRGQSM